MNIYSTYKVSFNLSNTAMNKKKNEMRDTGVVHFHHDHLLQGFAHHNSHYFKTTDSYLYKNVSDNLETQACVYLTKLHKEICIALCFKTTSIAKLSHKRSSF